ncbi:hypothetical protein D4R71_04045 [bacterium]|nr:MAG: hypothetical protein D4R71_04045 [bacterium]
MNQKQEIKKMNSPPVYVTLRLGRQRAQRKKRKMANHYIERWALDVNWIIYMNQKNHEINEMMFCGIFFFQSIFAFSPALLDP